MNRYLIYRNKNFNPQCFWSIYDNGVVKDCATVEINVPSKAIKVDIPNIPNYVIECHGFLTVENHVAVISDVDFSVAG